MVFLRFQTHVESQLAGRLPYLGNCCCVYLLTRLRLHSIHTAGSLCPRESSFNSSQLEKDSVTCMTGYYQTLLEATAADPQDSKTAFEILSSSARGNLDDWTGVRSGSETQEKISRSGKPRTQIVDPNIGLID
jgi:hypothetical protein